VVPLNWGAAIVVPMTGAKMIPDVVVVTVPESSGTLSVPSPSVESVL
jgi:hypothetical protein